MVWWCQSAWVGGPSVGSSGCVGPRPEHQSEPASSSGMLAPSPLPHRSAARVCQTLFKHRRIISQRKKKTLKMSDRNQQHGKSSDLHSWLSGTSSSSSSFQLWFHKGSLQKQDQTFMRLYFCAITAFGQKGAGEDCFLATQAFLP